LHASFFSLLHWPRLVEA